MTGEPWDPVERDRRYASAKRAGLQRLISEGTRGFDTLPPNIIDFLDGEGFMAIKRSRNRATHSKTSRAMPISL